MNTTSRRVLVTAGAAGIGYAIASEFLKCGDRVHICDVDQAAVSEALVALPDLSATIADVSASADLDRLFRTVDERFGGLDILVNNAGISGPRSPLEETDEADWNRCMMVNLTGAFFTMKRAIPYMKRQRNGTILNIATSSARTGLPFRSAYVASKAGLIALTSNAARELGSFGIRCNSVLPGIIDNTRGRALVEKFARDRDLSIEAGRAEFLSYVSMRTMISPAEVAETCIFLAGPGARHISGQALGVCGNVEWET